ncbi:MAG TPA: ParB/RepB/Spo0J family partition protein [Rhizomicrobium sp.]|jgi:ParB family chromosome partitioning protein|nr:ParB/RepB/Spo0J family partition protein [Rhizomicrobium sp.]
MTTNNISENAVGSVIRDIPLNKLVPSKDNVRKAYSPASVAELAASILKHKLLQNPVVRTERDESGTETGKFEVTAGGRRLAALKLLAKRKQIAKSAPIPCNVREDGIAKELSLAENVEREDLHPADEFEAFRDLHVEQGLSAEEIAARFGKTARLVKERLKLGAVSPKLVSLYRKEDMTLEQLMAFTVCDDATRQEEVWASLSWNKSAAHIRDVLLESHVPATDKRARFVGFGAYEAAGGVTLRDLFAEDDGGYLADPALLDRLAAAKLEAAAHAVRAEGWKWVEAAVDFPHGHGFGRFYEREVPLPDGEAKQIHDLETEIAVCEGMLESDEGASEEDEAEHARLSAALAAFDAKRFVFDPDAVARGGAFVTIGHDGEVEVVRGLLRAEDERDEVVLPDADEISADKRCATNPTRSSACGLSDRLIADLTAQRTMGLRNVLAEKPDAALAALTHALVLQCFYSASAAQSCLAVTIRNVPLSPFAENIEDGATARTIADRHSAWAIRLPQTAEDAWAFMLALPLEECLALLAHCVGLSVDAVQRSGETSAIRHSADRLAQAVSLDMTGCWKPTAGNYFGRVSKALIVEAVQEAGFEDAARRMGDGKKAAVASAAEQLLANTKWLPAILRTPDNVDGTGEEAAAQAAE